MVSRLIVLDVVSVVLQCDNSVNTADGSVTLNLVINTPVCLTDLKYILIDDYLLFCCFSYEIRIDLDCSA